MKTLTWVGDTKRRVCEFPEDARLSAGHQLWLVQLGRDPDDWKPMPSIGLGVREIRVREPSGSFRIVYIATLPEGVYVLHAFQKKTQQTERRDIELARLRLGAIKGR